VTEEYFNGETQNTKKLRKRRLKAVTEKSAATVKGEQSFARTICAHFGDQPVASITALDITKWLTKMSKKGVRKLDGGWTPSTRNRHKSFFSCVLHLAEEKNYIARWPMDEVDHVDELVDEKDLPTQTKFDQLLGYLPPYVSLIMSLMRYTGMRAGELHSLVWRDIDWTDNVIVIRPSKEKASRGRKIPMNDYVRPTLDSLRGGNSWVKENSGHKVPTIFWPSDENLDDLIIPPINIYNTLKRAVHQLLEDTKHLKGEDRWTIKKVNRHMMRHLFATDGSDRGMRDSVLMDIGGWNSITMLRRYRQESAKRNQEEMQLLNGIASKPKPKLKAVKSA
jgi:integrase